MKSLDVFLSQIFLSLETFLQKATTLNIFEALIFNYKIKVNSVEQCSPQFVAFVVDLCNEIQVILRESVVGGIDKLESSDKSESAFCELQPVNPNFVEFSTPLPSDAVAEVEDKEHWEPEGCPDVSPKQLELGVVDEQPTTPLEQDKHKNIYTCDYCNRKYRTNEKFSRHLCKSAPPSDPRDDESVDDPEPMATEHMPQTPCESENRLELPVYVCVACLSTYSQRDLFDQHTHADNTQEIELMTDTAQLQSQRKFSCGVCCEVYRSLARISYHVARCRVGPYHCELCTHVASTKQQLNRHKKKHHKGVESFFCTECGLGFKLRTSLQKHLVNRHESGQDNFPCDVEGCGQVFLKKIQLTNHRIDIHSMERKFLCQVCGHKFMTQDSLSCHLECHSNRKRFQCHFCSKVFTTKEKMTFHVRTHTGEKPFVCDRPACRKSFVSKSKLMEHLQRHNGEKRHKCPVCGKQYANKPDLRMHLRKIHSAENNMPSQDSAKPAASDPMPAEPEVTRVEQSTESGSMELYPSQLILQVDNPTYNNMQFYPEPVQLVRTVTVPQSMVITSYEAVIGM